MKKQMASVLVLAVLLSGCTGSFNLTKKVYNFHRSQSDKWTDELCFLLVALTPIYGLATFADALIFNSIEFWSGNNPVEAKSVHQGKDKVVLSYDNKTDQVVMAPTLNDKSKAPIVLERNADMVLAKNQQGDVLYSSRKNEQGDITIYDAKGNQLKNYSADDIKTLKKKLVE